MRGKARIGAVWRAVAQCNHEDETPAPALGELFVCFIIVIGLNQVAGLFALPPHLSSRLLLHHVILISRCFSNPSLQGKKCSKKK